MNIEQLKRANEIKDLVMELVKKRDQLKAISQHGIHELEMVNLNGSSAGYSYFKINSGHSDKLPTSPEWQPEGFKILLKAFVDSSITVYQQEIDKLEREFNAL